MNLANIKNLKARSFVGACGLIALLVLCVSVYISGLTGGFQFDDYANIVRNGMLQSVDGSVYHWLAAALSSGAGILRRPISMLSFAANLYLLGMNPIAFKLVNVGIHLLNGLLTYRLSVRLIPYLQAPHASPLTTTRMQTLALVVTGFWLLHPLNVSTVLYIVQRMDELAAFFTLAGLYCYIEGRHQSLQNNGGLWTAIAGLIVFGLLSTLSKENGALIVLYAFVIETVCFRFRSAQPATHKAITLFFLLCLALPCALFLAYLLIHPEWLIKGYAARYFTLTQRLLSEPRIMLYYLQWIFIPLPSSMGLYHDDIPLSTGLFTPPSTLAAIVLLAAAVALAWKTRLRAPAFIFGVAWFLAGHAMESTILPLEIVFEHRNYLPMFGLLLGCTTVAAQAIDRWPGKGVLAICIALVAMLASLTAIRAYDWGAPLRLAMITAHDHPDSTRSQYEAGREIMYAGQAAGNLAQVRTEARAYFLRAMNLDKTDIYSPFGYILTYSGEEPIPASVVTELQSRLRNIRHFPVTPLLDFLDDISSGNASQSLPAEDVERLVTAALDNPDTNAKARAHVLNNYGEYQFNVLHNAQNAISLTMAAAEIDPVNPFFQINIAKLAMALKRPDKAAQAINRAEQLDHIGLYQQEIKKIKGEIQTNPSINQTHQ